MWKGRRIVRKTEVRSFVVLVTLAAMVLVAAPRAANACSCAAPPPVAEALEEVDWAFTGRQIDQTEAIVDYGDGTRRQRILIIEVLEVYQGDVPDTVELVTGFGAGDCGVSASHSAQVGFLTSPRDDGRGSVSSCFGLVRADVLALEFEALPERVGLGPPGFVVGTSIGPARVAILDTSGDLLGYAEGEGRLAAAAVCPGGRKMVEIVERGVGRKVGGQAQPTLEVRDLRTLTIEHSYELGITERDDSQLNGRGWLFDLACHDTNAEVITYLLPTGEWDPLAGSNLVGAGVLHIWRNGELNAVDAGAARAAAVDAADGVFYTITGIDGRTLEKRDLSGRLLDAAELPRQHVGWRIALSADGAELVLLTRAQPMDRENWFWAEVNSVLRIDRSNGDSEATKLSRKGFATALTRVGGGLVAAVARTEAGKTDISAIGADSAELIASLDSAGLRGLFAVGEDTIILTAVHAEPAAAPVPEKYEIAPGSRTPIEGLVDSHIAVALPAGVEIANLPPAPTTMTTSITTTAAPPTSTTTQQVTTAATTVGPQDDAAAPATDVTSSQTPPYLAIVLLGLAGFAAVAFLAVRRRSEPKLGPDGDGGRG